MQVTTFVQGLTPTLSSRGTFGGNCCASRGPLPLAKSPSVSRRGLNPVRCTATWKTLDVDAELDKSLFELETKLVQAVEAEAYDTATALRDEIAQLQSPAFVEVLQAHMRFYKAFDSAAISDMARMWVQDDVTCVHPGGQLIMGYFNVIESFGYLFETGMPNVAAENVRLSLRGRTAYVTCDEIMTPHVEPGTIRMDFREMNQNFSNTPAEITMQCLHIYVRKNGEYLLTHRSSNFRGPTRI